MPDLPLAAALAVVPAEDTRLAEPDEHETVATLVMSDSCIEHRRPGSFIRRDSERQYALRRDVGHVALDSDADVPEFRRLSRDKVLLVVVKEVDLFLKAEVGMSVEVPHQVLGGEAFTHALA